MEKYKKSNDSKPHYPSAPYYSNFEDNKLKWHHTSKVIPNDPDNFPEFVKDGKYYGFYSKEEFDERVAKGLPGTIKYYYENGEEVLVTHVVSCTGDFKPEGKHLGVVWIDNPKEKLNNFS